MTTMHVNPPITFDINEFTQVVGDGERIIMRSTVRLQTLDLDEAMTMRDALNALIMIRQAPPVV